MQLLQELVTFAKSQEQIEWMLILLVSMARRKIRRASDTLGRRLIWSLWLSS